MEHHHLQLHLPTSATASAETTTIYFDSIAAAERECQIFIQQNIRDGNVHMVNVYWDTG